MPAQPKRRFLKLNVGEVSLVDSPANETEFLVTKNLEEQVMGEQHNADVERVEVEQASGGESDVAAVLKQVNAIVENIADVVKSGSRASAPAIAAATAETAESDDAESEEDVEKSSFKAMMKAAGIKMTPEQEEKLKAAGFNPGQKFPAAKPPVSKTEKAAEPTTTETALTIEGLSDLITKAKKFTPGRVEKLKLAAETLKGLLEEIENIPQGTNPGVSPGGSTQFGGSGVKGLTAGGNVDTSKAVEATPGLAEVMKAVNTLADSIKGVIVKVDSIEKARPVSQSVEAEGGTEKTTKSASIWSGVL